MLALSLRPLQKGPVKKGGVYDYEILGDSGGFLDEGTYLDNDIYVVSKIENKVSLIFLQDQIGTSYELSKDVVLEIGENIVITPEKMLKDIVYHDLQEPKSYFVLKSLLVIIVVFFLIFCFKKMTKILDQKRRNQKFKLELKNKNYSWIVRANTEIKEFVAIQKYIQIKIYQKDWDPVSDTKFSDLIRKVENV